MTVDSEINDVIEDLIHYPDSSIIFVGAGIGIPTPTNLPGGADVSNHLLYHLCEGIPEAFDCCFGTRNPALGAAPIPLLSPLNDVALAYGLDHLVTSSIRFETLLYCGWLKVGNQLLDALDCLQLGSPNAYHKFAARFLELGGTVITTNFDTHIENSLSPAHSVSVIADWPDSISANYTMYKLHGSLSSSTRPVSKNTLGATLRRVMAPPRTGQLFLQKLLERAERVVFIGYSFSDHFDITPVLRETSFRNPIDVLEYGGAPARIDPTSYLSLKLSHLLSSHSPLVYVCDPHSFFLPHVPSSGAAPPGANSLRQLAMSVQSISLWQRSQIITELLIFLGYYGKAFPLLTSSKPPAPASQKELVRHCLLKADVLSDTRSRDTISLIVVELRRIQKLPFSDFEKHYMRAQLEVTLSREHLRHHNFIRALTRYILLYFRTLILLRTADTVEKREKVIELIQVVQTYSRIVPGKLLWNTLQHVWPKSSLKRTSMAPDVALLELLRTQPSSIDEIISVRLVLALEIMNFVAAYMILRDSGQESDVLRSIQIADAMESGIGRVSARVKLAILKFDRHGYADAANSVDEAIQYCIISGRRPSYKLLIVRCLCRLLAAYNSGASHYLIVIGRTLAPLVKFMLRRGLK